MKFDELLAPLAEKIIVHGAIDEREIAGISQDSRKVKSGDLFVAVAGQITDGHEHITRAIDKGAVAVVGQRYVELPANVPYIIVPDSRSALATMAASFYQFPAYKLRMIGVTGTDGKTTTVSLIHSILRASGYRAGMITTIGAVIDGASYDTGVHVTTPDALEMQRYLSQMVASNADYAVLEVTSHALAQQRVQHCAFDVAVITNVTHEHLDYHGSYQGYLEAKAQLFKTLQDPSERKPDIAKVSIINADDASYTYLQRYPADRVLDYGFVNSASFRAESVNYDKEGARFTVLTPEGSQNFAMRLVGEHNVYNALAAIAAAYSQGIAFAAIQEGLASVGRIIGRMEQVDLGQSFDLFMDYAHTPNAIEKVLQVARNLTRGRVIIVCGLSGGLRDRSKRPKVGEIVGRLADKIVITAMDWAEEDVAEIMRQIADGCEMAGRRQNLDYWCVRDRKEGIALGINLAQPGDLVLIAGKAHEFSITYDSVEYPWNELAAIEEALKTRLDASV